MDTFEPRGHLDRIQAPYVFLNMENAEDSILACSHFCLGLPLSSLLFPGGGGGDGGGVRGGGLGVCLSAPVTLVAINQGDL